MAGAALSIKLRCGSWPQLATIYRRDLSRGSMFLKATSQPPIGTLVRIDLELPSATVIELSGVITNHVVDPQRGTGVDVKLEPLATKTVWLIESALAAENKVRAAAASREPAARQAAPPPSGPPREVADGEDIAAAEQELIRALESEAESLRKLNPFLVLGVGYEATDADVRAAFGELTKRYHPDRFARYQSVKLRQIAAEIFILIRDAYRRLADDASRAQVVSTLGSKLPPRTQAQPRPAVPPPGPPGPSKKPPAAVPRIAVPSIPAAPRPTPHDVPTKTGPGAHEAPTNPSARSAQLAHTELAKSDVLGIPVAPSDVKMGPGRPPASAGTPTAASAGTPTAASAGTPTAPNASSAVTGPMPSGFADRQRHLTPPPVEPTDTTSFDALLDEGKFDEALSAFRMMTKKFPQDRAYRAGIELCEGLRALEQRDRMEAAQRFEAALELDPSNERAARELADMRRQATNERKGLLSRLMGKKEPPP